MNILYLLVPIALTLAGAGVYGFIWAVKHGQFDDVHTPAVRIILEDEEESSETASGAPEQQGTGRTSTSHPSPAP